MSDGREEREEVVQRIERVKQEGREDLLDRAEVEYWEPERQES